MRLLRYLPLVFGIGVWLLAFPLKERDQVCPACPADSHEHDIDFPRSAAVSSWEATGDRISELLSVRYGDYLGILGFRRVMVLSSSALRRRYEELKLRRARLRCLRKVAMCVPTKNDALYLEEWVAYHLILGISHIYLYDNNSTVSPADVLRPFVALGFVTVISNHTGSQSSVYQNCISAFGASFDWIFAGDSDEFLVHENPEKCLGEFLEENFHTKVAVQLQWATYYSSGHLLYDPGALVIERFTTRARYTTGSKAIYRTALVRPFVRNLGIHSLGVVGNSAAESVPVNVMGEEMPVMKKGGPYGFFQEQRPNFTHTLYLNHYWSKSFEEYLLKRARGRYKKHKSYAIQTLASLEARESVLDTRIHVYLADLNFVLGRKSTLRTAP